MKIPKVQNLSDVLPDVTSMRVIYTPPQKTTPLKPLKTNHGDPTYILDRANDYYSGLDRPPVSFTEILDKAQEKMTVQIFEDRIVYEKLEMAINSDHIQTKRGK